MALAAAIHTTAKERTHRNTVVGLACWVTQNANLAADHVHFGIAVDRSQFATAIHVTIDGDTWPIGKRTGIRII